MTDQPDDDQGTAGEGPEDSNDLATTQNAIPTTQISTRTTQKRILIYLSAEPTLTRRELAERIGITPDGIK